MEKIFKKLFLALCLLSISQFLEACVSAVDQAGEKAQVADEQSQNSNKHDESELQGTDGVPQKKAKKRNYSNMAISIVGGTVVGGLVLDGIWKLTHKEKKQPSHTPKHPADPSTATTTPNTPTTTAVTTPTTTATTPGSVATITTTTPSVPRTQSPITNATTSTTMAAAPTPSTTTTISTPTSASSTHTKETRIPLSSPIKAPQCSSMFLNKHVLYTKRYVYNGKSLTEWPIFGKNRERLPPLNYDEDFIDVYTEIERKYDEGQYDGALNLIRGYFPRNTKTGKFFWDGLWTTFKEVIVPYNFMLFHNWDYCITEDELRNGPLARVFSQAGKVEAMFADQNVQQIFYHGQHATLSVVQDVLKVLVLRDKYTMDSLLDRVKHFPFFIPLRCPHEDFGSCGETIIDAFNNINSSGIRYIDHLFSHLFVSVGYNLFVPQINIFSNGDHRTCSPFHYFITSSKGTGTRSKDWGWEKSLQDILTHYDLRHKYAAIYDYVVNLVNNYELNDSASLLQIVIDNEIEPDVSWAAFADDIDNDFDNTNAYYVKHKAYESLQQIRLYAHPQYFCNPEEQRIKIFRHEKSEKFAQAVASDEYWNALIKLVTE